jgi:hypothetical protein
MKTNTITLEETFNKDFALIAIYTDEADYRLAFLLNSFLHLNLIKTESVINHRSKTEFTVFEYNNYDLLQDWVLINNHFITRKKVERAHDLFSLEPVFFDKKVAYLKKIKKAPFLLKLISDDSNNYYNDLVEKIKAIPQVYTCELISLTQFSEKEFKLLLI